MRIVRRRRGPGRAVNVAFALVVSGLLLFVMAAGFGTIPPLGAALDPGRGAWTSASGGQTARAGTLRLAGLQHPVDVTFTAQGVPSIQAATDHDAYLALGYVQARYRLAEMDSERRLGEGRLAQLAGPSELSSDEFELRLGLLRTARREWAATARSSPAGQALLSFSQGVNDDIAQVRTDGDWPAEFSLARVYPTTWTPVDSLVIQGVLTQELDFTTTPLDYALLEKSLGAARTMAWFPVNPANQQSPFDPGPYRNLGLTRVAPDLASSVGPVNTAAAASSSPHDDFSSSSAVAAAAGNLLAQTSRLPAGLVHREPDSNAWAANGPVVDGHGAMLAGDPHLPQTLPSIWYQAAISAPGLQVSGVTVPGVPGVLIGHNQHIAWSLTDTQNQATLFYAEQTSQSHPDQYYWRGAWHRMSDVRYTIPVRGGSAVSLTVPITVHGPIMTQAGQTMAVDWMGNVPSPDLTALLGIDQASNYTQFKTALASWHAPVQNFVYADDQGHIGEISAGFYPQVAHGDPWLPLSGTGADDIDGVIPYAAEPQVYDPPGHVIATANQRPVGPSYPYYIGTSENFFDNSYRANQIYATLDGRSNLKPAAFGDLQGNVTDNLAQSIVPKLVTALRQSGGLTQREQAALNLLARWDDNMTTGSAAASVWWTFWGDYISAAFQPWWKSAQVPVSKDSAGLALSSWPTSLTEDLDAWTTGTGSPPSPSAFTLPSGSDRPMSQVLRQAFGTAVSHLARQLGGAPSSWTWGRLHTRQFPSLTGASALGYGPRASSGDAWTVDAAEGGLSSDTGPSWRMVVDFSGGGSGPVLAEGIYPGGQSENPTSPWYDDLVDYWWDDRLLPMPSAGTEAGSLRWSLRPANLAAMAVGRG
ncbi:MAG TPA: penicillin acylase family protein [Streptosporangiaceae bacterium]|nr:penicillin acylase family protein [Streptosporangiaceae bacterium]